MSDLGDHTPEVWGTADLNHWVADPATLAGRETEDCLRALRAVGIRRVLWGLEVWGELGRRIDSGAALQAALTYARRQGMRLQGRLRMGARRGAPHFVGSHPEWHCVDRQGRRDPTRLSPFFPQVRAERIDALVAAARAGVDGLCLDFCERPPFARYHPDMVAEYTLTGGADPARLALTDEPFGDWCRFRAGFVTRLLRDLRGEIDRALGDAARDVPIMACVPVDGPALNLAAGLDVSTWCAHSLVDALCPSAVRWLDLDHSGTLAPYAEMARHTGVRLLGSVGIAGADLDPEVVRHRAGEQYDQGACGLVLQRAETGVCDDDLRAAIPDLPDPQRLAALAADGRQRRPQPVTGPGTGSPSVLPRSRAPAFPPAEL